MPSVTHRYVEYSPKEWPHLYNIRAFLIEGFYIVYTVGLGMLSIFGNLPREDSEAEEDLLTLNARSESLSSGLLL